MCKLGSKYRFLNALYRIEILIQFVDNKISMPPKKATSVLWGFFEKTCKLEEAQCKLCEYKQQYTTSAILKSHLLMRHNVEAQEELSSDEENITETNQNEDSLDARDTTKHQRLWNYFELESWNLKEAKCNFCDKIFSYRSTISNLQRHLRNRHPEAYRKYLMVRKLTKSGKNPASELASESETVEEPASPASEVPLDDDDLNFSNKFCSEVWGHFEIQGSVAHCAICNSSLKNTIEDMKNHLEDAHPSILANIMLNDTDSTDSESSQNDEENMFAEIECIEGKEIKIDHGRSRRSAKPFWRFFHKSSDGNKKAQCKLCGKKLSFMSTTGNIKKHLLNQHREAYEKLPTEYRKPASYTPFASLSAPVRRDLNVNLWNYFESKNKKKRLAICKVCRNTFSYLGTIANLKRHLKKKHPETFERYLLSSKPCPKDIIGGGSRKATVAAPVVKSRAAAVVEPTSPALDLFQDDDSNSSKKIYRKGEGPFEVQDCKKPLENDEDMKSHLEDDHTSAHIILKEDTNDSSDSECPNNEEMVTECVYLEDIKTVSSFEETNFSSDATLDKLAKIEFKKKSGYTEVNKTRKPVPLRSFVWSFFKKCYGVYGKVECNLCDNKTIFSANISNLKKHLLTKHIEAYTHELELSPKKYKNAILWKYFERVNLKEQIAKCNLCHKMIIYKHSIGNLKKHLRLKHLEAFKRYLLDSKLFNEKAKLLAASVTKSEPAIAKTRNNESSKKSDEVVWGQFEIQECSAYCTVCKKTMKNTVEDMKRHLEVAHPLALTDTTPNEDENDSADDCESLHNNEEEEDMTETVHLKHEIMSPLEQNKSSSDPTEEKVSSVSGKTEQEISTFLNYIGALLNQVNSKSFKKLQVNIIKMIMNETESELP